MYLAKNIKTLRKRYGMTGIELADLLGLKHPTISAYERGLREPTIQTILDMCGVFKVNVHDFLVEDLSQVEPGSAMQDRITDTRLVTEAGMWDYRNLVKEVEDMKKKLETLKHT